MVVQAGKVQVNTELDFRGFQKGLKRLESLSKASARRLKNTFSGIAKHAKRALLGITAVAVASMALAIRESLRYETALNKMTQTLKTTGQAAGLTQRQLIENAANLQKISTTSETAALGMQAFLLTFKSIKGDVFKRTTRAIIDMSEAMGQDLKSSAIQLGKALNDPVLGLSALSRIGIQFTDVQKDMIKNLVATNQLAKAQGVILTEVESQFGGVGTEMKTTTQALKQLWNVFTDFARFLGDPFLGPIKRAADQMRKFFEDTNTRLSKLSKRFANAINLNIETSGFLKTFKELIGLIFNIVKLKTKDWAITLGGLLIPIFEKLGQVIGDSVADILPRAIRRSTTKELKGDIESIRKEIEVMRTDPAGKQFKFLSRAPLSTEFQPREKRRASKIKFGEELIKKLEKQIADRAIPFAKKFADEMEEAAKRATTTNEIIKKLIDNFTALTPRQRQLQMSKTFTNMVDIWEKSIKDGEKKVLEERKQKIQEELGLISPIAEALGASQQVSKQLFQGFGGGGQAVALTGQELFGKGDRAISRDAQALRKELVEIQNLLKDQPKQENIIKSIDDGTFTPSIDRLSDQRISGKML